MIKQHAGVHALSSRKSKSCLMGFQVAV